MISFWHNLIQEFVGSYTPVILLVFLISNLLVRTISQTPFGRITFLVFMHIFLVPLLVILRTYELGLYKEFRLACLTFGAVAIISMTAKLIFDVLLTRLTLQIPRILEDVFVTIGTILVFMLMASKAGYNLTGLVATSAVLTAVVGFSLQDTLGNIMGGLVLQMDSTIQVGDWIQVDDKSGRVSEISWRYTAIETRNWETIIIPNSQLMKGQVIIQGRRTHQPVQWRRWVYFNVDFRHSPIDVINAVSQTLRTAALEVDAIAKEPGINCILMNFDDSYGRYAVRYWLTELMVDDPTDSLVRTWIYYALKRENIPLSMPAQAIFVTEESDVRKESKTRQDILHRREVLGRIDLFHALTADELEQLSLKLRYAPFAQGEVLTKQGAEGHWLYIIAEGEVSVRLTYNANESREIAHLKTGDFFGEMSLMTGAKRSSTVIALTDVECYRLDKSSFNEILQSRPDIAEYVAGVLAQRKLEIESHKEDMAHEVAERKLEEQKTDILRRIRKFFGLERPAGHEHR